MYLAVTILYITTAFTVNRVMALIEKKSKVPGFSASTNTPGGH